MLRPFTYCLAMLALLFCGLAAAPAQAQVLKGTFAAGATHALAIHADGTLWATGSNQYGQLGDGTTTQRASWGPVGTATTWTQVAAGEFYSLGLRTDGTLYTWGYNQFGQLGRATNAGTATPNATPTAVPGTWMQVAAGHNHVLALRADGTLWAWGLNSNGQLGSLVSSGMPQFSATPAQVAGTWAQVAAGEYHSLALKADGTLWAWGQNYYGQLGNPANSGTTFPNEMPLQVAGTYTQVAGARAHTLALRADGTLWAWGSNQYGQLGVTTNAGTTTPNSTPTAVPGVYTRLACEGYHSLALQANGVLYAWGRNDLGQLGMPPTTAPTPTPTALAGAYVQAAVGNYFSLALRADGTLWAWGQNFAGQLGSGNTTNSATPTATGTALPTRSTAAGAFSGLALRADGSLWAWGYNYYGQLGDGTTTTVRLRPVRIGTDNDWVQVALTEKGSLALKANGLLYAWGQNAAGQLGVGTTLGVLTPRAVVGGNAFKEIAAGGQHVLALTATGQVYAWGANGSSQLGLGTTADVTTPTALASSLSAVHVAAGGQHSLALGAGGQLYAWGDNAYGQLGSAAATGPTTTGTPTLVAGLPLLVQAVAGTSHSLVRTTIGTAYAWGYNYLGQLSGAAGLLTNNANPTPRLVPGVPAVAQVATGAYHSLALTAGGALWAWGSNAGGELGQGLFGSNGNPTPNQEVTGNTDWATMGTGCTGAMSLVRTASGLGFASAGPNSSGQLGDGTTTLSTRFDRTSPLTSLQPLPVLGVAGSTAFGLAPNPAHGQTTAVGLPAGSTLAVYDALGRLVLRPAGGSFGVGELPAGLYLVRATTPGQASQMARLLVE